jgi:ribosomal protein S18 acetylase RimI-like enzyme
MDRLDNAAWHALTGPHAGLAEVAGVARRYPPSMSFYAAVDGVDAGAWAALADLAGRDGPQGIVTLSRPTMPVPPAGWREVFRIDAHQMVLADPPADEGPAPVPAIRPLGPADVPAMLALTGLAQPGPFFAETVRFGGYVGVEEGGGLLAMAGRRLRLDGATEISAVCVHPDAAGRGLGRAVTGHVARAIQAEGDEPFLHVSHGNEGARRLYERLGFTVRTTITFASFAPPPTPRPAPGPAGRARPR